MTAEQIIKLIEERRDRFGRWADEADAGGSLVSKKIYLSCRNAMRTLLDDIEQITAANAAKETK